MYDFDPVCKLVPYTQHCMLKHILSKLYAMNEAGQQFWKSAFSI